MYLQLERKQKYKRDAKANAKSTWTVRELFIGMGRSPCKITSRPFAFDNNSIVIYRGLDSLFLFKSVSSFLPSCRSFLAHSFGSVPSFVLLVFLHTAILTCPKGPCLKVPVHVLHSRNIVKSRFLGPSEAGGPQQAPSITSRNSTTSVVPSSWPYSVPYSCEYQNSSPAWYIFIWSHKCNLFSMQGQSVASNNPYGSPSPSPNQSSCPHHWCSSKLSCETCLWHILDVCGLIYVSTC
jgi:hypothetical protein